MPFAKGYCLQTRATCHCPIKQNAHSTSCRCGVRLNQM
jgi:hypothetical protein